MASYNNLKTFEEHLQDSGFAFTDREEKIAREFFERGINYGLNATLDLFNKAVTPIEFNRSDEDASNP